MYVLKIILENLQTSDTGFLFHSTIVIRIGLEISIAMMVQTTLLVSTMEEIAVDRMLRRTTANSVNVWTQKANENLHTIKSTEFVNYF